MTTKEGSSITPKIFTDNEGKLPNDFVAVGNTTLYYEPQLEVPLFQLR